MSTIFPVCPLIPHEDSPLECLAYIWTLSYHKIPQSEAHPELRQNPDGVAASVLDESAWDNLHRIGDSSIWPTFDALDCSRFVGQAYAYCHLGRASSWSQIGMENDISGDGHSIGQVSVDFVQNIFRGAPEKDCTSFGGLALSEEGKISAQTAY